MLKMIIRRGLCLTLINESEAHDFRFLIAATAVYTQGIHFQNDRPLKNTIKLKDDN